MRLAALQARHFQFLILNILKHLIVHDGDWHVTSRQPTGKKDQFRHGTSSDKKGCSKGGVVGVPHFDGMTVDGVAVVAIEPRASPPNLSCQTGQICNESALDCAGPMRYRHRVWAMLGHRWSMRIMGLLNWVKSLFYRAPPSRAGVSPFQPDTGPARLIVLRHAEKTGDKRDRNLSPAGQERAMRLAPYVLETFGRPDFLIAAKSSDRSRRPVETIEPLAAAVDLEIKSKFDDDEVDALVAALGKKQDYRSKFGVISWRHSDIPRLVATLGAPAHTVPSKWSETDYTTLVDISYSSDSKVTAKRRSMPF
jgi:hypothetical protein